MSSAIKVLDLLCCVEEEIVTGRVSTSIDVNGSPEEILEQGIRLNCTFAVFLAIRFRGAHPSRELAGLWTIPLIYATDLGRAEVVSILLLLGADVAETSPLERRTALHVAARRGHRDICILLCEAGASPDVLDARGDTPLHLACRHGHTDTRDTLLTMGADVGVSSGASHTPLHDAAAHGHADVCALLASVGAVGLPDGPGPLPPTEPVGIARRTPYSPPLHLAANGGHVAAAAVLLQAFPAATAARDGGGLVPLHVAAWRGHVATVELLLEADQSAVDATSVQMYTPLLFAARGGHTTICQALLSVGAAVGGSQACGTTPLHRAAAMGHHEMCRLLIDHGAVVNARDSAGRTPLEYAVTGRAVLACRALLKFGADPNTRVYVKEDAYNDDCDTHPDGVSIDGESSAAQKVARMPLRWQHILHTAVLVAELEICSALVEHRVNVLCADSSGNTPIGLAEQHNFSGIVDFLTKAAAQGNES